MLTKLPQGTQIDLGHPIGRSIGSCWRFAEGGGLTAYDSARKNHGTLVGAPAWTNGDRGRALSVATTDYVQASSNSSIDNLESFSIYAELKCSVDPSSQGKIANKGTWELYIGQLSFGQRNIKFDIGHVSSGASATSSNLLPEVTQKAAICVTFEKGSAPNLFWNGRNVTNIQTAPVGARTSDASWPFRINHNHFSGAGITGAYSQVLLTKRALTPSEVRALFQDPDCYMVQPRRSFALGSLGSDATATVKGTEALGETGTVIASGAANVTASGSEALAETGAIAATGNAAVTITGTEALGETGTVIATSATIASVTGSEAVTETGNAAATGSASAVIIGTEILAESGTVTADNGAAPAPQIPSWLRLPLTGEIDAQLFSADIDGQELTAILG